MKRIRFLMQQALDQPDGTGGYTRDWADVGYVWGEFKALSGGFGAYDGKSPQYKIFKVNLAHAKQSGLREGWRLVCDERAYEVLNVFEQSGSLTQVTIRSTDPNVI